MAGGDSEWLETFQSPNCARDAHDRCPHLFSMGGYSLRWPPSRLGALLCQCSCHSSCPATSAARQARISAKAWHASCTCPGAELTRQRLDEAGAEILDSDELWEKAKRDSQAQKDAFRAAEGRAIGRSREEVREIYLAELRSRGLPKPSERALNAAVERIMGNPLPAFRLAGEGLIETGKLLHAIVQIFRRSTGG